MTVYGEKLFQPNSNIDCCNVSEGGACVTVKYPLETIDECSRFCILTLLLDSFPMLDGEQGNFITVCASYECL